LVGINYLGILVLSLLSLESVSVCVDDRIIVRDVSLNINPGELHVIMGPNGVGKSTLLAAIMGLSHVRVCGGRILFNGVDITHLPSYERAKLGISLAHQVTPTFRGVRFLEVAKAISSRFNTDWRSLASLLRVEGLLLRDLFHGFSGGERRRAELYLALLQNPKLLLLDEPDSGVDVDTLRVLAGLIEDVVYNRGVSAILVTHSGAIVERMSRVTRVHVMVDGSIVYSGDPSHVIPVILKYGYVKGLEVLRGGC
jgi:Fe-S cluster assembly ATP-binding protein